MPNWCYNTLTIQGPKSEIDYIKDRLNAPFTLAQETYGMGDISLSADPGLDWGATFGSYLGLFFLAALFTAIGIWCSSLSANTIISFLIAILSMAVFYYGFHAISLIPGIPAGVDYWVEWAGIDFHYRSMSRGLVMLGDLIYFSSLLFLFFLLTLRNLRTR